MNNTFFQIKSLFNSECETAFHCDNKNHSLTYLIVTYVLGVTIMKNLRNFNINKKCINAIGKKHF